MPHPGAQKRKAGCPVFLYGMVPPGPSAPESLGFCVNYAESWALLSELQSFFVSFFLIKFIVVTLVK